MPVTRYLRRFFPSLLLAGWFGCSSSDNNPSGPDLSLSPREVQIVSATSDDERGGWVTVVWTRYSQEEDFVAYTVERGVGDKMETLARVARDDTVFVDRDVQPGETHRYRVSTETVQTLTWSEETEVHVSAPPDGVAQRVGDFEISDAAGLEALVTGDGPFEVRGDLMIRGTQLTSLAPLSNLVAVHGNVRIYGNPELIELGLTNLEIVSGYLSVGGNPALSRLDGLRALRHVGGRLTLSRWPGVLSLAPLGRLQSVGGALSLGGIDFGQLAMPSLESVGGLDIRWGTGLADLNAFSSLQRIDGPLRVRESDLVSLTGIEDLVEGITRVELQSNPALMDLTALSRLQSLESLWISANDAITSLEGLHNVAHVDSDDDRYHAGDVIIQSNTALADLDGLRGLRQVSGSVWTTDNAALTDAALATLEQVGHTLWIIANSTLQRVDLSSLSSVAEVFEISDNPALALLDLSSLADVGFLILENNSLPTRLADVVAARMRSAGLADNKTVVLNNLPEPVLEVLMEELADGIRVLTQLSPGPLQLAAAPLVVSFVVDVGAGRLPASLEWSADVPAGTSLELRARTGSQAVEATLYYDVDGNRVTEERYEGLELKGATVPVLYAGEDWTNWSEPYTASGQTIPAATGQYVEVQVTYASTDLSLEPTLAELVVRSD